MAEAFSITRIEEQARALWRDIDLLGLIQERNKDGEPYFLLDGPPYANNVPHVGHLRTTVYKDLCVRMAMMRGKDVLFQPGFDTHGLPIENMVEKSLGFSSKQDIERLGIAQFCRKCRESAALNKDEWLAIYEMLGSWYAQKTPYLTYDNSYLESAWWAFRQAWDRGLVADGKRPVHWCPHCQTALAGYEVTDSYKMLSDPGVYVRFRLVGEDDTYLLAFTTTPWTLPSNVALVVNGKEEYVKVKTHEWGTLILAKQRLPILAEWGVAHTVLEVLKGEDLDGVRYEPLMGLPAQETLKADPNALRVFLSIPLLKERVASKTAAKKGIKQQDLFEDFVTVTDGTGIVHCAPGHGHTDFLVGTHYQMPALSPLDEAARFTHEAGVYAGSPVRETSHKIADDLSKEGKVVRHERIDHSYPICWRCKTPLVFRLSTQWFFRIESLKEPLLEANERINWLPDFARERMRNWVANASDWNFSRQRYWGIPIPIWICACGHRHAIGSKQELIVQARKAGHDIGDDVDLHAASEYRISCSACGGRMTRIPDIFDVWYDSGCAPFASLGYPRTNKELFEKHYPVTRISESQDQIRGWFYALLFLGQMTFGKQAVVSVSMPGWVVDEKGEKMSKSVGNFISARDAIAQLGADPVRFYYAWDIAPYELQKFSVATIKNDVMKMFTILWNLTALAERADPVDAAADEGEPVEDRWLRSRWNTTLRAYLDGIDAFELHVAGRALYEFLVSDVSRAYVQLTRERAEEDARPMALVREILLSAATALAPIAPHMAEEVYQRLRGEGDERSVHLRRLPVPGAGDAELEAGFGALQAALAGLLAARDTARISVRWPVPDARVFGDDAIAHAASEHQELLRTKANSRVVSVEPLHLDIDIMPDANALGRTMGVKTGDFLTAFPQLKEHIRAAFANGASYAWEDHVLTRDHFKVTSVPPDGWVVVACGKGYAAVSTHRTPELESEGLAREIARRIQHLRKTAGFEKGDRISVSFASHETQARDAAREHAAFIAQRVNATDVMVAQALAHAQHRADENVKGIAFSIGITRV